MSLFTEHPRARWALPAAAVGAIGAAVLTVNQVASADSGLPPRTAEQLIADVRSADVSSLSGTVVQTVDLGLPALPGLGGAAGGSGGPGGSASSTLTSLLSGTHTWRIWVDGPSRQRLALIGNNGESDIIHNGTDVWLWSSADRTAVHHELTADATHAGALPGGKPPSGAPTALPSDLPRSPDEAARSALALMGKDTSITTTGAASVAGRSAYELVLTPKDPTTLVRSVRIAIDAQEHVPLRVQVNSTKLTNPAFEVGFTAVDFATPDASRFQFTPPPGTTVTESGGPKAPKDATRTNAAPGATSTNLWAGHTAPRIVGSGWSTVVVAPFDLGAMQPGSAGEPKAGSSGSTGDLGSQLSGILKALPATSGTWGSGHVLSGTLFSAVITDDGRIALGAVSPDQLTSALAAK